MTKARRRGEDKTLMAFKHLLAQGLKHLPVPAWQAWLGTFDNLLAELAPESRTVEGEKKSELWT